MPQISDLFGIIRGAAAAPQGYRESGFSGVAQAFQEPQTFEAQSRDAKYREAYADTIASINDALKQKDFDGAVVGAASLEQRMRDNNARPADIQRFAGGYLAEAFRAGLAEQAPDQPQGQNFAVRAGATLQPEQAPAAAAVGARLPAARLGAAATEADIARTQGQTESTARTMNELLPAQVEAQRGSAAASRARAAATDRGETKAAGNLSAIMTRNLGVIQKYDRDINKMLTDPLAMQNPNQVTALIEMRNSAAQTLSEGNPYSAPIPQVELGQFIDPQTNGRTFALKLKEPPQASQGAAPGGLPSPPTREDTSALTEGAAVPAVPAAAGAAQRRSPAEFRAAVQNPLGALPAALQQQLGDPNQITQVKIGPETFAQQGFSIEEGGQLLAALMRQIAGQPLVSPHPASPGFQTPYQTPGPQRVPTPAPY